VGVEKVRDRNVFLAAIIIDPEIKHPATEEWERAFRIFELLL